MWQTFLPKCFIHIAFQAKETYITLLILILYIVMRLLFLSVK